MTGANLEIANSCKPLISCIALIQAYASFDSHAAKLFLGKICVFFIVFILQHKHKDIFEVNYY